MLGILSLKKEGPAITRTEAAKTTKIQQKNRKY